MDLLGRYLQAVKFWLPKAQQDDILAELGEDLRSQAEEAEAGMGRKLNDAEMEALLKKRGRPMLVAMRYRPRRYLIGPGLFPMYVFVLKVAVLCYLVPWAIGGLVLLLFGTSHPIGQVLGSFWGSLWTALAMQFSIITIVFAAIEHFHASSGLLDNWNPRTLPAIRPVKDPYRVSRFGSAVEIVLALIFIAWWIIMPQGFPFSWGLEKAGIHWTWGPVWQDFHTHFFVPIILFSLLNVGVVATNLFHPYWTRPRLVAKVGINAAVALMAYFVVRAHLPEVKAEWLLMTGPNHPVQEAQLAAHWINMNIWFVMAISVVASAAQCLKDLVKAIRWREPRSPQPAATTAAS